MNQFGCMDIKRRRIILSCHIFFFGQVVIYHISIQLFFLGGGRGLNLEPCIYYALSLPIELSSRGHFYPTY